MKQGRHSLRFKMDCKVNFFASGEHYTVHMAVMYSIISTCMYTVVYYLYRFFPYSELIFALSQAALAWSPMFWSSAFLPEPLCQLICPPWSQYSPSDWLPGLIQLIWLARQVSPSSLTTLCASSWSCTLRGGGQPIQTEEVYRTSVKGIWLLHSPARPFKQTPSSFATQLY